MADTKEHVDDDQQLSLLPKEEKTHISQNLRVLAIDDNVVCLKVLVFQLQKCGYQEAFIVQLGRASEKVFLYCSVGLLPPFWEVTATTEASEAIEILRKNKDSYDIVITDVVRYDMDGFKLLEIIGLELDIPVIMTSADDDMRTVDKGIRHGARDYLVKPVRIEILRNIWQHVIRKTVYNPKSDAMEAMTVRNSKPNKRNQRDEDESGQSTEELLAQKKTRIVWKPWLHEKFVNAVQQLEVDKAVPKKILELMNEPNLTREHVASHLQKYRNLLKKEKERMGQGMTNGIPHLYNPIVHAPIGNHGLTFNHSTSYNGHGMNSFAGKNHPFLPHTYNDIMLQKMRVLSEDGNQRWKNMAIPMLQNVAPVTTLTANPELSAIKYQTIQNPTYGQISSQRTASDSSPRYPESFPNSVGNSSGSLPILSSRPHSYFPTSFNPTISHQVGYIQPFQDSSVRENNIHHTQPFQDSSIRENNSHQMIEDFPDDDLSVMVKQFANDTAPAI